MDQLIISWLGLQESKRHNTAQEQETARHNAEAEKLQKIELLNKTISDALGRSTQLLVTSMNTAASRYSADKHAHATEYAARTSAEASRYATRMNSWNQLQHEITSRQANAIQRRQVEGNLAIAAYQAEETKRANKAREAENRASRLQSGYFSEIERAYKQSTLDYQKEKDWLERTKSEREFETNTRLKMSGQLIDLLGVGAKARMFSQMSSTKGGNYYGTTQQTATTGQEPEGQAIWDSINKALIAEGR